MRQHSLFETEPAPWELDDAEQRMVATLVFPTGPPGDFDYLMPDRLLDDAELGRRMVAPLGRGNRPITGYCVRLESRSTAGRRLKEISQITDREALLSPAMIRLTRWMADYYLCTWGQVLEAVVPAGVRSGAGTRRATLLAPSDEAVEKLDSLKLSAKQRSVIDVLLAAERPMLAAELADQAGCTVAPINTLRKKGLIESQTQRITTFQSTDAPVAREQRLALNVDQRGALDAILKTLHSAEHQTVLIHGVTGSGKTEVYMQAIEEVIGFGRQAIVLVPEISLTPQTRERFRRRFDRVAVLHSHQSDAERAWRWQQIAAGHIQVIVGARSAIFAPTRHLGLIVLDEEHETSFKQDTAPRYHARQVAIKRAEAEDVPLVLGSATPSLDSWHRASTGEYQLVAMPRRVMGRPMPAVATVDLRAERESKSLRGAISRPLHQAMDAALKDNGQVILLLNRRGFATHIQCPACGFVVQCPHCELALTHHRENELALCHYCDHQVPAPLECPDCHAGDIRYSGRGTQKLEAEVRARFPAYTSLRMDTDSMQGHGSHEQALDAFRRGDIQILLGTQMIAKGLDFPNVTLVGVVNADTALHLPDFRAAERTFHLVTQVAGRTGRSERGGRVLVQTLCPEHPAIQAAVRHDYAAFAAAELPIRAALNYPPYTSMVRLVIRGPVLVTAEAFAKGLAERIRSACDAREAAARVLGPAPAPFPKLRGKHRLQIQTQARDGDALRAAVRDATGDIVAPDGVQWIADVDPIDML
jgi:primosomal protein N' (replication factor Y)